MRLVFLILALTGLLTSAAAAERFTFAAMGDAPYRLPGDLVRFEQLIATINERGPVFSIHVGDIKSGSSSCKDAALQAIHEQFQQFRAPLFYTPGDNEWTDCHRKRAGGFDPLERLARLRAIFFPQAMSLGQRPRPYMRQADQGAYPAMVENAIWRQGDVLFATVHVVGSNNGFERNAASVAEYEARDRANQDWLARAFRMAGAQSTGGARVTRAIIIAMHADPNFGDMPRISSKSGFKQTLESLAAGARLFGGPVLIIQGDSHKYIVDRPLRDAEGKPVDNVTRLQVMGAPVVGAVLVQVDTEAAPPFAFTPLLAE